MSPEAVIRQTSSLDEQLARDVSRDSAQVVAVLHAGVLAKLWRCPAAERSFSHI